DFLRELCDLILIRFPLPSVVTLINDSFDWLLHRVYYRILQRLESIPDCQQYPVTGSTRDEHDSLEIKNELTQKVKALAQKLRHARAGNQLISSGVAVSHSP